jgi:hypothetical protein
MGQKKLAVLVIHGMGTQERAEADPQTGLYFSHKLYSRLAQVWDEHRLSEEVAWKEVRWASVFNDASGQNRQTLYLDKLAERLPSWGLTWLLRGLVMQRFADAAAYYPTPPQATQSTYARVHDIIDTAMAELEQQVTEDAQLVVLAHSLGAHIMSNYIYDVTQKQNDPRTRPDGFQSFQRLKHFVTFGANIPVFTFSLRSVQPIRFPAAEADAAQPEGWWRNYYSRFDPLGYPLEPVPGYAGPVERGEIFEERVDVGSLLSRFTPVSHNAYWSAPQMARRIADLFEHSL